MSKTPMEGIVFKKDILGIGCESVGWSHIEIGIERGINSHRGEAEYVIKVVERWRCKSADRDSRILINRIAT